MAAAFANARIDSPERPEFLYPAKANGLPQFSGVFRGRELTRKDRRIAAGLPVIEDLLDGGIVRGRISEFIGGLSSGKTSLALRFAAQVTRFETAAWIESSDNLDPASLITAGVEPSRMLWVSCRNVRLPRSEQFEKHNRFGLIPTDTQFANSPARLCGAPLAALPSQTRLDRDDHKERTALLRAAEWILAANGFGLIVLDFADTRFIPQSAAIRLARAAERSGAAIIVLAENRLCGTFAAISLALKRQRLLFSRIRRDAPALFDGQMIEARVMRNKLGGSGRSALWKATLDPFGPESSVPSFIRAAV
jgi:hypothetical protein